jgi:acyl dehydratase
MPMARALETHVVEACNTAKQSENKMHDDSVARRFGFAGGLVPGVDVMAYMMHLPVAHWGRAFLERGLVHARFLKPVYDGETVEVTGSESEGVLAIEVLSRGELCATGSASLPEAAPAIALSDFRDVGAAAERQPVGPACFVEGNWLGTVPRAWPGATGAAYRADIRESDPIYAREGLGHPGLLQRVMNRLLVDNVILGPWIHVGSRMQMLSVLQPDDEITARAKVIANYEKKGHRFVELDGLMVANGKTPLAHCHHVAIYQPREQAAA